MIRIAFFAILFNLFTMQNVLANYLSNSDISKINYNTVEYMKNFSITDTRNEIESILNKDKFNSCFMFEQKNKNYLPDNYFKTRCLLNSVRELSEKKGFYDALGQLNKKSEFVDRSYLYVFSENDQPEEITDFKNWFYPQLDVEDNWVKQCQRIPYFDSPEFSSCIAPLYRLKDNIGFADNFRKFIDICDYYYPGQDKRMSDSCMKRLSERSNNPFERVQTACLLQNYTVILMNNQYVRKSVDNKYYQCLSDSQNSESFIYWQAQRGYEYGYSVGLYIVSHNIFNFLEGSIP